MLVVYLSMQYSAVVVTAENISAMSTACSKLKILVKALQYDLTY